MELDVTKLNMGEIELLHWQYDSPMSVFKTQLWKAITCADNANLGRLKVGYPDQIQAYISFVGDPKFWPDVLIRAGLAKKAPEPVVAPGNNVAGNDGGELPGEKKAPKKEYGH